MSQLKPPEPLNFDSKQLSATWRKWRAQFQLYVELALADKNAAYKNKMLLYVIGERGREIYPTLNIATAEDERTFENILNAFETFCIPTTNVTVERYRFFSRNQDTAESIDEYFTALRTLSQTCEFAALEDSLIKDRIVGGIRRQETREKLLHTDNLDLTRCLAICRSAEFSESAIKEISQSTTNTVSAVRHKTTRKPYKQSDESRSCKFCNTQHEFKAKHCPAWGKTCSSCGKENHFAVQCEFLQRNPNKKKKRPQFSKTKKKSVKALQIEYTSSEEESESDDDYACIYAVSATRSIKNKLFAKMLLNGSAVKFQIDCGATCNIVPKHLLTRKQLLSLDESKTSVLHMYNNTTESTLGEVNIKMRNLKTDEKFKVRCSVLKNDCQPILGSTAAQSMNLFEVRHENIMKIANDEADTPLTSDRLIQEFQDVFERQGLFTGTCKLTVDETITPTIQPPRRIPVSLRQPLRSELDRLEKEGILSKVTEPTKWVNGLVCVAKPNGKLRVCLDPRPLNVALQRNHYPMKTIEDILPELGDIKVFSVFDAKNGFWHVKLDDESSKLTSFNTVFGKYKWNRLPFGLNISSEEYQVQNDERLAGLEGIYNIVDDILVGGRGPIYEAAVQDHDSNVRKFLARCRQENIKLNKEKVKFKQDEVKFIGHKLTSSGIKPDQNKVKAIIEMPAPEDTTGLRRLLGSVNYLGKFIQNLSEMCHPISNLLHKDVAWHWDTEQEEAFKKIKEAIIKPPVLKYYNPKQEVTVQCDSSKDGLGCVLLQNDQPVAFASRALTSTEKAYSQIEKEMLSCVFAITKFHTYVYGRKFKIENDHKPLEVIMKKPIHTAPKRIQAMMVKIQGYDFEYVFKKGKELFIADTLSRAFLTSEKPSKVETNLHYVNGVKLIPMTSDEIEQIRMFTEADLSSLKKLIQNGWPDEKDKVNPEVRHYFGLRDELTIADGVILKGERIVIPKCMRKDVMKNVHSSHIGIEGCLRRARESVYWPGMNSELRDYMTQCEICNQLNNKQQKEPMIQREVPSRPWGEVGTDLCFIDGKYYLAQSSTTRILPSEI